MNRLARALEDDARHRRADPAAESRDPGRAAPGARLQRRRGAFLQVEARAAHDRLTGVANRETLLTTLVAEIERATRHHKWLSVAFIDIDRFKPINDTYGHNCGDAVLREIAGADRGQHPRHATCSAATAARSSC